MTDSVRIGLCGISYGSFWGFEPHQYHRRIQEARILSDRIGFELIAEKETYSTAEEGIRVARWLNDNADAAILDVATYPEGRAFLSFAEELQIPLVLWARNETVHGTHIGHNSFCGANFLSGNLARQRRYHRIIYGPVSDPELTLRVTSMVRLIAAAKALSGSRIGLFGEGIVPKFYDIDVTERDRRSLENRYGISFMGIPIDELCRRADSYADTEVESELPNFLSRFDRVAFPRQAASKQVRLLKAALDTCREHTLRSVAIRCWPELQDERFEGWPCPTVSALNEAGVPCACEGDPGGAWDMLLATQFNSEPSTLVDIVDWDDEANTFSIWHCGPTACSWADAGGAQLLPHNVDGRTPDGGPNRGLPGVVDMQFAEGPVTVFRTLGTLDDEFIVQGEINSAPDRRICGCFGAVAEPNTYGGREDVRSLRRQIFHRGLPHHYAAVRGHVLL